MNQDILNIIKNFVHLGEDFVIGKRNKIKIFEYNSMIINIKSFKKPIFIQGVIYRFFRPSKAKRSFLHAKILEEKNIGTPKPIGYYENKNLIRLLDSYYVCEHLVPDLVFKDLFARDRKDENEILKQFASFSFKLHEAGIEFLDHSPGNTLIKVRNDNEYDFFLVDLNRMRFHTVMDFSTRMKNLSRITASKEMIRVISFEYARLCGKEEQEVFNAMWHYTNAFQERFYRKKRIKKTLFFWK